MVLVGPLLPVRVALLVSGDAPSGDLRKIDIYDFGIGGTGSLGNGDRNSGYGDSLSNKPVDPLLLTPRVFNQLIHSIADVLFR